MSGSEISQSPLGAPLRHSSTPQAPFGAAPAFAPIKTSTPPDGAVYRSALPLARLASFSILAVLVIIALDLAWTSVGALAAIDLGPSPPGGWSLIEKGETAFIVLYFAALLYGGVTFLRCQRQLIRNLQVLGKPAPALDWATLCWFIPMINLIAPAHVFHTIAESSAGGRWDARPLVTVWWLTWILAAATGGFAGIAFLQSTDMTSWLSAAAIDFVSGGLRILSGGLAILLLYRLSRQQESIVRSQAKASARETV